ncbi:MAG: glycosyltransferase [Paracoccaceae bacterium]
MRPKKPRLSVIMANYNGSAHLREAVNSVLRQSMADLELIVSDDCSTDDSLAILSTIDDERLRVVTSEKNTGPAETRNRALDQSNGTWVAVVDADDLMHVDRFHYLLDVAEKWSASVIADDQFFFGSVEKTSGKSLLQHADLEEVSFLDAATLLSQKFSNAENCFGYLKPIIRRNALENIRYRSDLRIGEDFDLLLRLALAGNAITLVPDALYYYRRREGSISHRLSPKDVESMINALADIQMQAPQYERLIKQRLERLKDRMTLETVVLQIKSKQLVKAVFLVSRNFGVVMEIGKIVARKILPHRSESRTIEVEELPEFALPSKNAGAPKVHVRVPTFRRPTELRRALESLQAQTVTNWVCDVFDDDLGRSGEEVVIGLADPRIHYNVNSNNLRAQKNIDQCFTRKNKVDATYFCVLEDDNQLLPEHLEKNMRVIERENIQVVLRNQLVELNFGAKNARLGEAGLLDEKFVEGVYAPETFHLAVMADMGVSNGGLFWSRHAKSDLEIQVPCSATLQEYLRTFAIIEPVYVAMKPTAIWAENGSKTTRDIGARTGWLRRELALKRSVQILQRLSWKKAGSATRAAFLADKRFNYPTAMRATGLVKSHARFRVGKALSRAKILRLATRGALIRVLGKPEPGLRDFLSRSQN